MDAVRVTVERLREQIRALEAAPRRYLAVLRTEIDVLDQLLRGGFALGQAVELWGEAASGRTSVALRAVAAATRQKRLAAWVDGAGELYPPTAVALGVELSRLLIVRPPSFEQLLWAGLQLVRSGAFACVALDLTRTGVRPSLVQGKRLTEAAARAGVSVLVLTSPEAPGEGLGGRLAVRARSVDTLELEVLRRGEVGRRALLPWAALYPEQVPVWRHRASVTLEARHEPGPAHRPFHRPKRHAERDGGGLYASRPGRDTSLPRLGPSLGIR